MNRRAFLAIAIAVVCLPAPLAAQSLNGMFVLNRQASDDMNAAIDAAVAGVNAVLAPPLRNRLRLAASPPRSIRIDGNARRIQVTFEGPRVLAGAPIDGGIEVTERRQGGTQIYTIRSEPGGNRLTIYVAVSDRRMARPLTYRLVYDRAS